MRILYVTTLGRTMWFFKSLINELIEEGNTIDMACNEIESDSTRYYEEQGLKINELSCSRNPFSLGNFRCIKEIRRIVRDGDYDIVHCHTPIAAACTRIACRKLRRQGVKVVYTAHGFHFYKGAPQKNWIIYYPIESLCARWTDLLITINTEDYELAKNKLRAEKIAYVPGVGIDIGSFCRKMPAEKELEEKRLQLGVSPDEKMLISVGELNANKNHEAVIRALAEIRNENFKYFICGKGALDNYLYQLICELELDKKVKLLGYRDDIAELCGCADIYVFPSFREGLSVALMEAIASRTPVLCSRIRGNVDLIRTDKELFDPANVKEISEKIQYMLHCTETEVEENYSRLLNFDINAVNSLMKELYGGLK